MDPSFPEIAKGIQSIAITVGVLVGGSWTLYTFIRLKQVEKAKAELKEQKQKLFQQAVINLSLRLTQVKKVNNYFLVKGILGIRNDGTKNTNINFEKLSTIQVFRIDIDDSGEVIYDCKYEEPKKLSDIFYFESYVIRTNHSVEIPFFITLDKKGVYHFELALQLSSEDIEIANRVRMKDGETAVYESGWTVENTIEIKD